MNQLRREGQTIIADLLHDASLPRVVHRVLKAAPEQLPAGERKLRLSVINQERRRRERGQGRGNYGEEAAWYTRYSNRGHTAMSGGFRSHGGGGIRRR